MDQHEPADRKRVGSREGGGVLGLLDKLGDELGAEALVAEPGPRHDWPPTAMQRAEDEALLVGIRQGLARLAASRRRDLGEAQPAVEAVLDGAQLIARNKILTGRRNELGRLLPAFAYLVMLPLVGEAEADRVAGRAESLVAAAMPAG